MENVIEKDTVYLETEVNLMSKEELTEVLKVREIEFHHMNGEEKLRTMVLESNFTLEVKTLVKKEADVIEVENTDIIVKLELVQSTKTGTIRVRDYTDAEGHHRVLLDKNGTPRVVTIRKQEKLNLSIENDRLLFEHLKDHPVYVLGSDACIRLVNTEEVAEGDNAKVELAIEAKMIIKGLDGTFLRDFSRVLNIQFNSTTTDTVLKSILYAKAETNPEEIHESWDNPDRETYVLIYKAIDKEIIKKEKGVYKYDGMILGNNFEDCVLWIKQNENVLPGMRKLIA
jgi:hypothetical protein